MLIEMWSPVFKKHGEIREPICFHHGLNVIMGMDLADNSIGKSSSLLAIDFIFGGNSYLKSIAVKKLGNHPIYFCFQFEKKFYFSRDTANPDIILVCDKSYSPTGETMDLGIFLNKLKKRYHLDSPELSFRLAMSGFFRIAGKVIKIPISPYKFIRAKNLLNLLLLSSNCLICTITLHDTRNI